MSLILHAVERLGIDLDSEESEYDAYVFYQVNWEARFNNAMTTIQYLIPNPCEEIP